MVQEEFAEVKAVDALNEWHNQMSEELIKLLNFNLARRLDSAKAEYEECKSIYTRNIDEEERIEIETMLDMNINDANVTADYHKQLVLDIVRVEQLLTSLKIEKSTLRINFDDINDLIAKLDSLEKPATNLSLNMNDIWRIKEESPIDVMDALPEGLETLDLKNNNLQFLNTRMLINMMRHLPKWLRSLSLAWNYLKNRNANELASVFSKIPDTVTSLDLDNNYFGEFKINDLKLIFRSIPMQIKSLSLNLNDFEGISALDWNELIGLLPAELEHIWCGNLFMHRGFKMTEKNKIMNDLSRTVTSLTFSGDFGQAGNISYFLDGRNLRPNKLHSLGLVSFFHENTVEQIEHMFSSLPESIRCMDLSTNLLADYGVENMKRIFAKLPPNIRYLNLSDNKFFKFKEEWFKDIFSCLPDSVRVIDLSGNKILTYNKEELELPNVVVINDFV